MILMCWSLLHREVVFKEKVTLDELSIRLGLHQDRKGFLLTSAQVGSIEVFVLELSSCELE